MALTHIPIEEQVREGTPTNRTPNRALIALDRGAPFAQYQYVDITFHATPDTDTEVTHTLRVVDPEAIDYQVVRADRPVAVYHDQSASRQPWGKGYIILRLREAGWAAAGDATVTLLLTVRNT